MTTIIVTGGAGFCDKARIFEALNANHESSTVTRVLVGDSSKAEKIAADWAKANDIPCAVFMLDFSIDRREAVSQRHQLMLGQGVDAVIAFPGGASTNDVIRKAVDDFGLLVIRA